MVVYCHCSSDCTAIVITPGKRYARGHHPNQRPERLITDDFLSYTKKLRNGCLIWLGASQRQNGRGRVSYQGRSEYAYRVAYMLFVGPIPEGKIVRHRCPGGPNPSCVNPKHLRLGTHKDNSADRWEDGTMRCGLRHPRAVFIPKSRIRAIQRRYAKGGISQKLLGRKYGYSRDIVSSIVDPDGWRHIA